MFSTLLYFFIPRPLKYKCCTKLGYLFFLDVFSFYNISSASRNAIRAFGAFVVIR